MGCEVDEGRREARWRKKRRERWRLGRELRLTDDLDGRRNKRKTGGSRAPLIGGRRKGERRGVRRAGGRSGEVALLYRLFLAAGQGALRRPSIQSARDKLQSRSATSISRTSDEVDDRQVPRGECRQPSCPS